MEDWRDKFLNTYKVSRKDFKWAHYNHPICDAIAFTPLILMKKMSGNSDLITL